MGSLRVSGKLLTYPFVEPTLTLASYLEQNVCLGKGRWTVSQKRIMIPKMTARDPALPNPSLEDRPLQQTLCKAPFRSGPPTLGSIELQNSKIHTHKHAGRLLSSRLAVSLVFFEPEPRFSVNAISLLNNNALNLTPV